MGALIPIALNIVGSLMGAGSGGGVASSIIGLLGGSNAGAVAEKVIGAAKSIFGTDDPQQIALLVQQDKSKAEVALAQMNNDLAAYRLQVEDTKSARERDVEVRKISGGTNTRANVMLISAFACLMVILGSVVAFRSDIPDGILALMNMSAGAILGMLVQAFNFEFGSSRSSGEKTDQMATMMSRMETK
jgi:hypothetical protein